MELTTPEMKYHQFYRKYRANYPLLANPIFSKRNWWLLALMVLAAFLIEPLIMYKHHRSVPFSATYYFQQIEYFAFIFVPFFAFLLWAHWREIIKRRRGYGWLGKFEVISKRSSFVFCYLVLSPGEGHELKVDRKLFEKTKVGDFIQIHRDAVGSIQDVCIVSDVPRRLTRGRLSKSFENFDRKELA